MKQQKDFGRYNDEKPFDYDFGNEEDHGDHMLFPDDTETAYALVHSARAEVVAVDTDRDRLVEFADHTGLRRESSVVQAPFGVDAERVEFPTLP